MPSSRDRRRIELPTHYYDKLKQIAAAEDRTVTSVLNELLHFGLMAYRPTWIPKVFMDRFDERARRVLALAEEEARQLNHQYIGTEHLLLGLLREGDGIAAQALRRLWIETDKVRDSVVRIIGSGDQAFSTIEYVPRVRKVLAFAVDEAQTLGHDHVGTEHLLLGLVREGQGIAAGTLDQYGVITKVREQTLALLRQREMPTEELAQG